jgi:hypothetical protein
LENTFSLATNAYSSSTGKYNGTANSCPYISTSEKTKHGTVYVLSGSAGQIGGTQSSFPHAAMTYSNATTGGSLAIEIEGNRLDAKFVAADNTIKDQFTIFKDVNKKVSLSANPGEPLTLNASWNGNYSWTTGATTHSVTVTQSAGSYQYVVSDNASVSNKCLSDTFSVRVGSALLSARSAGLQDITPVPETSFSFKVFPNPVNGRTMHLLITSQSKQNVRYMIQDINGRLLQNRSIAVPSGSSQVNIHLPAGVYFLKVNNSTGVRKTEKIVVQ